MADTQENNKRTSRFAVRMTNDEFEVFEKKLKTTNLGPSEYVRRIILQDKIPVSLPEPDYDKVLNELHMINKELKRLSTIAQQKDVPDKDEFVRCQKWFFRNIILKAHIPYFIDKEALENWEQQI